MYPSTNKQPKRVGGAPFSSPRKVQSLSARSTASKPAHSSQAKPSLSARDSAYAAGRGDGLATPNAGKAEDYYNQLLGRAGGAGPDTRQDWTLLQEIDALDHFNTEEQKRRSEKEKNVKNQAAILEAVQARHVVADKCRHVWKQWRAELEDDVVQYEKEEQMKRVFKKETQIRFNQERQRQLADVKIRQAAQKETEKKIEQQMMDLSTEAKKRQDEADESKKGKQRQAMMQMKTEAENAVERRSLAKKEEHKLDIRMQKEYEELLEVQEKNRGQYFQSIREKQSQLLAKYEKGVGNELARLAELDDERAKKQQEAKSLKEQRDLQAREQWRCDLAESGRVAVQNQLSLQAQERQKKIEEDQKYLEKSKRESAISEAKETEKVRKQKAAVLANAEYIKNQIREKEAMSPPKRVQLSQMNDVERQLNRDKLQRATDPQRNDGLKSLLAKKEQEYRQMRRGPLVAMPS